MYGNAGYTDQQLIAGRAIHASFTWLNRERDDIGKYKERRLARSGGVMTSAIAPMGFFTNRIKPEGKG